MAQVYYPAIIERGNEGFGVFFPDLPGCTSYGDTVQDAARNAEDALSGHLLASADCGFTVPGPSEVDAIERDPDVDEVVRILVKAELPGKSVRISITIDDSLLAAIDKVARNRSGFLADGARALLSARQAA